MERIVHITKALLIAALMFPVACDGNLRDGFTDTGDSGRPNHDLRVGSRLHADSGMQSVGYEVDPAAADDGAAADVPAAPNDGYAADVHAAPNDGYAADVHAASNDGAALDERAAPDKRAEPDDRIALGGSVIQATADTSDFRAERLEMVRRHIATRGIDDPLVLDALRVVPRHRFVPRDFERQAYADRPLPIGHGQTISQPYIVAYMTELVEPDASDRVLEIGTGSGYQAAVLAEIVDSVYTMEIVPELASTARERLQMLGYGNVRVRQADGYFGWEEHAPFDAIVVTAAAEHIPPPLVAQLKDGGRMIIPVGSPFRTQTLMLIDKQGDELSTRSVAPVRFVPFTRDN